MRGGFGFYIVDFLPSGMRYNSSYFIENILIPLSEKKALIWNGSSKKKIWLHLDNSMVDNSKTVMLEYDHFGFKRPPHPAYWTDVAPSDFYLFGYLEEKLKGKLFKDVDDLQEALNEILCKISHQQRKAFLSTGSLVATGLWNITAIIFINKNLIIIMIFFFNIHEKSAITCNTL